MISIQILVPHIHVTYGFETEERSLKGDTDPYITCKSVETFQHLTTNSNYVSCYNAESSHLEMVKIVGSWCLSQYSFFRHRHFSCCQGPSSSYELQHQNLFSALYREQHVKGSSYFTKMLFLNGTITLTCEPVLLDQSHLQAKDCLPTEPFSSNINVLWLKLFL